MASRIEDGSAERRPRGRPRAWGDTSEQNTIKSLDRAIDVLQRLSELGGATLSDLATDLDESPATVYRVLFTFQSRGIVDFEPGPQSWHIGAGAFLIGSRFLRRTSLIERARPVLRDLMRDTGETANLAVAREGQVLFMSQVETHANIRAFFPPGSMSPLHASGIGKALLAQMSPEEFRRFLKDAPLQAFTEHTLTLAAALEQDLQETRQRGYAVDNEEKNIGMRCIAAAIFDSNDEPVAGISVSGPSARLPDDALPQIGARVAAAAREVTQGLGGTWPGP